MRDLPFEESYIGIRRKEGRIYSDDEVKELPHIPVNHNLINEWRARKASLKRLITCLNRSNNCNTLLEVGCGNGWLSYNLMKRFHSDVCGLDINETELTQGARVFKSFENLSFLYGDIFTVDFKAQRFDVILLASSAQYFDNFEPLIDRLLPLLNSRGAIYIIDTPFYYQAELQQARKRSREYFAKEGLNEMTNSYFHHTWSNLNKYNRQILFRPDSLASKFKKHFLRQSLPVFPIILIKKNKD